MISARCQASCGSVGSGSRDGFTEARPCAGAHETVRGATSISKNNGMNLSLCAGDLLIAALLLDRQIGDRVLMLRW